MSSVGGLLPGPKVISDITKPPFVLLALRFDRPIHKTGCRRVGINPFRIVY